ncbi:MAG TPA: DUF2269 family protein [Actinomycetota bacterium]|nr:DUF2269 family protein [Actinomycetota bacterium]
MRILLLYAHIVLAILWIGGAVMFNLMATRARSSGSPEAVIRTMGDSEWAGKFYFTPVAILTLVTGVVLVLTSNGAYTFEDPFVVAGIAGIVISGVLGGTYYAKAAQSISAAVNERGLEDAGTRSQLDRLRLIAWVETAMLLGIELLMVYRAGS